MEATTIIFFRVLKWLVLLSALLVAYACTRTRDFCLIRTEKTESKLEREENVFAKAINTTYRSKEPEIALEIEKTETFSLKIEPNEKAFITEKEIKSQNFVFDKNSVKNYQLRPTFNMDSKMESNVTNKSKSDDEKKFIFGLLFRLILFVVVIVVLVILVMAVI